MPRSRRLLFALTIVAVAGVLVLGAAGLSGHLADDDYCAQRMLQEGAIARGDDRWAPPGYECLVLEPSGTTAEGRFLYEDPWQRRGRLGSWPAFLGTLLVGIGVVGAALRRRDGPPTWLRVAAVATLAFAVAGVGAYVGGWAASALLGLWLGVPLAYVADRWLRPGRWADHRWTAGPVGVAVGIAALVLASTGWLLGLGLVSYGLTILLVVAGAALISSRRPPRLAAG